MQTNGLDRTRRRGMSRPNPSRLWLDQRSEATAIPSFNLDRPAKIGRRNHRLPIADRHTGGVVIWRDGAMAGMPPTFTPCTIF
jgi:hypothetical protein